MGINNIPETFVGSRLNYNLLNSPEEVCTLSSDDPGSVSTYNFDVLTQGVRYNLFGPSGNWTINFRGDSSRTLNSTLEIGQSITLVLLQTLYGTGRYPIGHKIDGTTITPKWQGGAAPSTGSTSAIDAYVYTIIKTDNATFTVLASQTKFA